MEVSVSPRATMWLVPPVGVDGAGEDVDVVVVDPAGGGAPSPTITPGRELELPPALSCCCNFRICCESKSIFVFCSSIFFVRTSSLASAEKFGPGEEGAIVCAEANCTERQRHMPMKVRDMVTDFCIALFRWQARAQFAFAKVRR